MTRWGRHSARSNPRRFAFFATRHAQRKPARRNFSPVHAAGLAGTAGKDNVHWDCSRTFRTSISAPSLWMPMKPEVTLQPEILFMDLPLTMISTASPLAMTS